MPISQQIHASNEDLDHMDLYRLDHYGILDIDMFLDHPVLLFVQNPQHNVLY